MTIARQHEWHQFTAGCWLGFPSVPLGCIHISASFARMRRFFIIFVFSLLRSAWSFNALSRRALFRRAAFLATTITAVSPAFAAENPRDSIQQAQSTLSTLLDNWQRATVDCTFADVPRDLLEQKNKELLLEKASTYALFDKSVSVETCKTTNRIVRDYLGVTGKGPLVGMDKKLKLAMDSVDVERLEDYIGGTMKLVLRCTVYVSTYALLTFMSQKWNPFNRAWPRQRH